MGYLIRLKLLSKYDNEKVVYECRNLQSLDWSATMPTSVLGLPEAYFQAAIITKADGNTAKLNFTWVIKDEDTTPFTTITSWGGTGGLWNNAPDLPHSHAPNLNTYYSRKIKTTSGSDYQSFDLKTADGQMVALSEMFEKRGFTGEDKHQFELRNDTDGYDLFQEDGIVGRISFQKAAQDPVTWNCSIEFTMGDVIDASV